MSFEQEIQKLYSDQRAASTSGRCSRMTDEMPLTVAELRELEILLAQHPQRAEKPILHGALRCVRELLALREVVERDTAWAAAMNLAMLEARHDRLREAVKDARGQDSPHVIHKILDAALADSVPQAGTQ